MQSQLFEKWNPLVRSVAGRFGKVLSRYGWDADDAQQHASMKLVAVQHSPRLLAMSDECLKKYLPVMVRRALFKAVAVKRVLLAPAEDQVLALTESRGDEKAAEVVTELMADAPRFVKDYLRVVLVEGRRWVEGRDGTQATGRRAAWWVQKHLGAL